MFVAITWGCRREKSYGITPDICIARSATVLASKLVSVTTYQANAAQLKKSNLLQARCIHTATIAGGACHLLPTLEGLSHQSHRKACLCVCVEKVVRLKPGRCGSISPCALADRHISISASLRQRLYRRVRDCGAGGGSTGPIFPRVAHESPS